MAWVGVAVAVAGTALQYSSQKKAASAERKAAERKQYAANIEAAHMEQQAVLSVASAQRQMLAERKNARLVESRAQAVAAASGAGAADNTVVNIISDIAAEGAHRSSLALYDGLERARQLNIGAAVRREGGDIQAEYGMAAAKAHEIGAVGTLFSGAGSLYAKYGTSSNTAKPGGGGSKGLADGTGVDD